MGLLFRAVFSFAIAYAIYAPHSFAAHFDTPRMVAVKAELAATHPGADLRLMIEDGLRHIPAKKSD